MNNQLLRLVCCLCILCFLCACGQAEKQIQGSYTTNNENEYANAIPVEITDEILKTCYDYADSLGYEIKDKSKYKSVILGESHIKSVHLEDDAKSDMLDKSDYLILFDEIKIVIDADTGIILGNIPYV